MLSLGKPALNFTLPDDEGKLHRLHDYSGNRLIIFLRYLG